MIIEYFPKQRIVQHLSNEKKRDERIGENLAQEHENEIMGEFIECIKLHRLKLSHENCKYLHQENENAIGMSAFYYMPKGNKNKNLVPLYLVMSKSNTKLFYLGK